MSESTTTNPNIIPVPELEQQASLLLGTIMDNPQAIGANEEDGSYSKTETVNEVREKITIGTEQSGVTLVASRQLEHDPQRHLPGKFVEALSVYASIPGIAQVLLATVDGKIQAIEYSDQFDSKNDLSGLEDAVEAIKFAVEELESVKS
jgi:hypothetical protein